MRLGTLFRNRYMASVLVTLAVLLGLAAITPLIGASPPLLLFLVAVIFAAGYGGVGPGLLAVMLAVVGGMTCLYEPSLGLNDLRVGEQARVVVLALVGVALSVVVGRSKQAESQALLGLLSGERRLKTVLGERAEVEQALREREHFANKLIQSSLNGVYLFNPRTGTHRFINPEYTRLTGYSLEALTGLSGQAFYRLFHPDDLGRIMAHIEALEPMAYDETLEIEYRFRTAEGRWMWCLSRNTVFSREADGSLKEILGAFFDITERKLGELATAYERSLLDTLQMHAPVGLGFVDRECRFVRINETLAGMNGLPVAEHLGRTLAEVVPNLWPQVAPIYRQVMQTGEPVRNIEISGETAVCRGCLCYWWFNIYPVCLQREIVGVGIVVTEVTATKRAEAEIRQLNADLARRVGELQTLFDLAPIGLIIAEDPECQTMHMNKTLARLVNLPERINASLSAPPEQRPPWRMLRGGQEVPPEELPIQRATASGQTVIATDLDWVMDDGRIFKMLIYAAPLFDEQGRVWGGIGALVDMNERLALEEQLLRHATQLQAMNRRKDEFLATLAHELRNPLAPIKNAVHVLHREGVSEQTVRWARDLIGRQVEHLTHLVNDLLDVSRITRGKITLEKQPVALAAILDRAIEACAPSLDIRRQTLHSVPPPPEIWVEGDQVRLVQVVINLLDNAAKYSPEGSRIWLATETRSGEVGIRIRDEGLGIAADFLPVIFEVFAQSDRSLDRAQGGLGIGLALVKSLVEMHGGRVEASSAGEGQGSEFVIWLPLWRVTGPETGRKEPDSGVSGKKRGVLEQV